MDLDYPHNYPYSGTKPTYYWASHICYPWIRHGFDMGWVLMADSRILFAFAFNAIRRVGDLCTFGILICRTSISMNHFP